MDIDIDADRSRCKQCGCIEISATEALQKKKKPLMENSIQWQLIFIVLVGYDCIVLAKVIADMLEHADIAAMKSDGLDRLEMSVPHFSDKLQYCDGITKASRVCQSKPTKLDCKFSCFG